MSELNGHSYQDDVTEKLTELITEMIETEVGMISKEHLVYNQIRNAILSLDIVIKEADLPSMKDDAKLKVLLAHLYSNYLHISDIASVGTPLRQYQGFGNGNPKKDMQQM